MKFNYKILACFLMCFMLIGMVSAWSYDNSRTFGDASAYAKITGTAPICDGERHGIYCAGEWYTNIGGEGTFLFIGINRDTWPTGHESTVFTEYNNLFEVESGQRYPLNVNGEVPYFILCAWDRTDASNGDWAWASKCGGLFRLWKLKWMEKCRML